MDSTTSVYDHATFMFPGSDNSTRMVLRQVLIGLESLARPAVKFQVCLSVVGLIVTAFHIFILTRKLMMASSIISIMIGVAVCDFVAMVATIETSELMFDSEGTECSPPASFLAFRFFWAFAVLRDMVRRSSTWLGVLMALIRFLMVRFDAKSNFRWLSEVQLGFKALTGCFVASSSFSAVYYFRYDIVVEGSWRPRSDCLDIPLTTVLPVTVQKMSTLFTVYNGLIGRTFMLLNGIVSKLIPCVLLPLLTVLLISELRRADIVRKVSKFKKKRTNEKTTGLVIFMAVSFFIVELPIGITTVFQVAFTDWGFLYLATYVNHFCNALFILNATGHCLICFLMSSQYKTTVANLFRNNLTSTKRHKASTVSVKMSKIEG